MPLGWSDPITENPALNAIEIWELHNFTEDAHPIHIHEVQFQVVDRQPFDGDAREPEPWEGGFKDTVIAYPGEITRVKAHFDLPGLYVWHCHIVEHEDKQMRDNGLVPIGIEQVAEVAAQVQRVRTIRNRAAFQQGVRRRGLAERERATDNRQIRPSANRVNSARQSRSNQRRS